MKYNCPDCNSEDLTARAKVESVWDFHQGEVLDWKTNTHSIAMEGNWDDWPICYDDLTGEAELECYGCGKTWKITNFSA